MKKILFVLIAILGLLTICASAANVGDKISEAVYSDITAYINNYPMPCYVIDGYAVVVAEDLRNYCCDVYFDSSTRTLSITKSAGNTFKPPQVYKTAKETGEFYTDVLYTDIQTYVNNNWVKSFNVNGKTMIVIDEFGKYMDGYEWDEVNRAAKAYMTDKPQTEFKNVGHRTVKLFEQANYAYPPVTKYEGAYDLNFDGINEKIQVNVSRIDASKKYMKISAGEKTKELKISCLSLDAVYLCDVDPYDGYKDIAVVTTEEGINLRIFKGDGELTQYQFKSNDYFGKPVIYDFCSFGFISNPEFSIENDKSILMENVFNATAGSIYTTYKLNENDIFEEVIPAYYTIDNSRMANYLPSDDITGYERSMWEKGYIKAYKNHSDNGVVINRGEYFRVLYFNGYEYIFVEKENGNSGWIYLGENMYELNPYYFHGID